MSKPSRCRPLRSGPMVLVTLAVLVAAAGCGKTLNMEKTTEAISEGLVSQLGLPIASVECPESRDAKEGDSFECIATPKDGGRLTVKVSQEDDGGNISWEVVKTEGLLDLSKLETSVKDGLKQQTGVDATVSCGGRWRPAAAGDTFECEARTADGRIVGIVATATDDEGNVTWETK